MGASVMGRAAAARARWVRAQPRGRRRAVGRRAANTTRPTSIATAAAAPAPPSDVGAVRLLSVLVAGGVNRGSAVAGPAGEPGSPVPPPPPPPGGLVGGRGVARGAAGVGRAVGRGVARGAAGVGRAVGRGVAGARARGASSPTIALGWMLRSWFLLPAPSSCRVRMCHGAPETCAAPSGAPPLALSQYADWARCPPQASRTAEPVDLKRTRKLAVLLPFTDPAWVGPWMLVIVPPQMVSRRGAPEYVCAPLTAQPVGTIAVGREREARRPGHRRAHRGDRAARARADLAGRVRDVPGREEVVRLVAAGREVVVDVDRVVAGLEALEGDAERHDAAFRVPGVVAVQVAVLPGLVRARPLVEVDADPGADGRDRRMRARLRRRTKRRPRATGERRTMLTPGGG